MDSRPGFATGKQLRMLDAMWSQVTRAEDEESKEKALNSFCHRIAGVAGLRMLKIYQVEKIVKALQKMGAEIKPSGGAA
jgi:phytoene/squalene synthetase